MTVRNTWTGPVVLLLLSLLALPAAGLEVSGRLTDAGGAALPGARVELVPIPDGEERGRLLAAGAVILPAVATGESDDEGRYRVSAPGPGLWGLVAWADGFVPMAYHLMPLVEATGVPEVSLLPDAGAAVRVLDPQGRPVTGARVRGRGNRDPVWRPAAEDGWLPVRTFVRTRADGRARLPRAAGETLPFSAWAPPWVETAGQVADGEGEAVLRLRDGVERVVEVLSPAGEPVPGASVVVGGARGLQAGTAGRGGRLRIRAVEGEPVELVVAAPGELRGRFRLTPRAPPEGSGGDAQDGDPVVPLPLVAEVPLPGTVIDARSGEPLAGAVVWKGEAPGQWTLSGADGAFALPEPPGEGVALRAAAAGYLPAVVRMRWTAREEPWSVALTPAARLAGRVLDPAGEPVAGARVELSTTRIPEAPEPPRLRDRETRSDPEGRFLVEGLPAGAVYELRLTAEGYAPAMRLFEAGTAGGGGLRIVLVPGGVLTGRVVRATGEPAAGAEVRVQPTPGTDLGRYRTEGRTTATVDAEGRFTIGNLVADLHDVLVRDPRASRLTRSGVAVQAGRVTDLGLLQLDPEQVLVGRVEDEDGEPVPGAQVVAWPWRARSPDNTVRAETGTDGEFRLRGLESGRPVDVEVQATHGRRVRLRQVPPDAEEPLVVVLPVGVEVFGRVVDETGDGVGGAWVSVYAWSAAGQGGGGQMEQRRERSGEDGSFRIAGLPPGRVRVEAFHGSRSAHRELGEPLAAGERRGPLALVMPEGVDLAGRVLRADGTPAVGARVAVRAGGGGGEETPGPAADGPPWPRPAVGLRSVTTGSSGTFRFTGGRPGATVVTCDLGRAGKARWEGEVEEGGTWIELRAEPRLYVAGRVRDVAGRPVVAVVRLSATDGTVVPGGETMDVVDEEGHEPPYVRSERSRADGSFFIGDLPPGRYAVSARARGFVDYEAAEPLEVGPEPVDDLDLRLSSGVAVHGRLFGVDPEEIGEVDLHARAERRGLLGPVRPGADGRYRVEGLSPGRWHLSARLPRTGRQAHRAFDVRAGDEEIEVDLDLAGGVVVEGELRVAGVVPPGAVLHLSLVDGEAERAGRGYDVSVPLLHDGSFRAEGLVPGRYELRLSGGALRSGPPFLRHLEVASDRSLYVDFAAGRLEGRVVDAAGPPVPGVRVSLLPVSGLPPGQYGAGTFSGDDGSFDFPFVPTGRWRVEVLGDEGTGAAEVVVSAGTTVVEVTVQ